MLDEKLVQTAKSFVDERFPGVPWAGAAAMYLENGSIVVSTSPSVVNASVELCHEVGAICEAYKLNQKVVATVCVSRDEAGKFHILTPCGVCQERLMSYGPDVQAAVPVDGDSTKWQMKTLGEIQPYYWRKPFLNENR